MGVLPLQYLPGENAASLGLTGLERFTIEGAALINTTNPKLNISARRDDGTEIRFQVVARLDTPIEVEYYLNGGILQTVLYNRLKERSQ
jgi:aconitate hydratase